MPDSTVTKFLDFFQKIWDYIRINIFNFNIILQFITSVIIILLILTVKRFLLKLLERAFHERKTALSNLSFRFINSTLFPFLSLVFFWLVQNVFLALGKPFQILQIAVSLSCMWIIINIGIFFIKNSALKKIIFVLAMIIAVLGSIGLLDELISILDSFSLQLSGIRISLYTIFKAFIVMFVLGWIAKQITDTLEKRIKSSISIKPSLRVLISKILKVTFFGIVFIIVISSLGISLTAFAVLTGAIGIGIGLGLQKVVSNLISGIILLLDESVKPGDVIEIDENFGWIKKMGARYISVVAIDGKEYLIPNEDLITGKVINWSHSDELVRIDVEVGCAYKEDIHLVMKLMENAVKEIDRVLKDPAPKCFLTDFGDSSVNFRFSFWINDPSNGILNIKSDVLVNIWDTFKENQIQIPFPQRDIHIRTVSRKKETDNQN